MEIWGLTGGMASGKSTVAAIFRRFSVPVFDADKVVKALQSPTGRALPEIKKIFPELVSDKGLDRAGLRKKILGNQEYLKILEGILHPLVAEEREKFIKFWRKRGKRLIVLDIPLLFETGFYKKCDKVMVTIAPFSLRHHRIRVRYRYGAGQVMSAEEAKALIGRQISDKERRRHADIIFYTVFSHGYLTQTIKKILVHFYHS